MSTAKTGRVPFIPHETLRAHHVHEMSDDRFRSAARLRQALLREKYGWPIGLFPADGERKRELGSYLAEEHNGANFITPEIARLAAQEIAWREDDALIDQDRLYRNLLSSMPATLNLLGPLKLRPRLADSVMRRICPGFVSEVSSVLFEHSPARRHPDFTADRTAFDALCKITTPRGEHGFVAIEVKYTESLHEQPAQLRPRYDELSTLSGLFVDPDHPELRTAPLQQLWRQHLLAFALVKNGLYSTGRFIVIAPELNRSAQDALAKYRQHLRPDGVIAFDAITFNTVIAAIHRAGARDIAALLHERYIEFSDVDALV
jgi:hypothetical protein